MRRMRSGWVSASTSYLMSMKAPELIHAFDPDARLIAMVPQPSGHRVLAAQPADINGIRVDH